MSPTPKDGWTFGVEPLEQTRVLASLTRRVISRAVSLEAHNRDVGELIELLQRLDAALGAVEPLDPRPRIGPQPSPDQRVYVDHARDIGAFNPCFPEYSIDVAEDVATGTVTFPVLYEGPPGIVHGGFLAVFFDCVVQHHNCDSGVAGKTTELRLAFRRPTPILEALRFTVRRATTEHRIVSDAELDHDGEVLCRAHVEAVLGSRDALPEVSPRRTP